MSEQQNSNPRRSNVAAARVLLLVCGLGLGYFWLAGNLSGWEAVIAGIVLTVVVVYMPSRPDDIIAPVPDLNSSEQRADTSLAHIVDAMADPCFLLDHRGVLDHKNASADDTFQHLKIGDLLTLTFRHPQFVQILDEVINTGKPAQLTFMDRFPSERWYKARISSIVSATPDLAPDFNANDDAAIPARSKILVMMTELTEQKRAEQMRADFVANASHELRTPLTAVIGYLDTLMGPARNDREAHKKFMPIMRAQAERMSNLVDDLLSLSRIELKEHVQPRDRVNLLTTLEEVSELLRPIADGNGNEFVITNLLEESIVTGERIELVQVFENLLDNALKYGEPDTKITIEIAAAKSLNKRVAVRITNKGSLISAEHLPRLTERFYRVDVESSRAKKGTGLGLAIAKHIITRHRGNLSITSDSKSGTTVTVELP